jgi:hypothetical protein
VRKTLLAVFFNSLTIISNCQPRNYPLNYWQQQVNFTIDVTLNDKDNSLDGFEKIEYINNSPDTLRFIWFHIWPNAYKNDKTAFSDQMLLNGDTKFYFSGKEQRGYINRLDFKVNNTTCAVEDHPAYIDVVKVILATPLMPTEKITLTTPFHVQLPYNFSRGGHDGDSYQVTQWYPKPAVYDQNGWHPMPYLHQGEFYSEFGNFDVRITVPKNYVVAATGELQNEEERQWLLTRNSFSWEPVKRKARTKGGSVKTIIEKFPTSSTEAKTLQYIQTNVHDFAWFADKRFIVNHDSCQLASGKIIDVFSYYTPAEKEIWSNSITYAKRAIRFYSTAVGEYPYNVVSAAQGPKNFEGGMEYPTITGISPVQSAKELDMVLAHEIGHNWFYGILASNERNHPWMDEGINSYYEHQYTAEYYKDTPVEERIIFETFAAEKLDQPIETPSEKLSFVNYDAVAYYKTAEWLRLIEEQSGKNMLDSAMKEYYRRWQFKHPQPEDFAKVLAGTTGRNMDSTFHLLRVKGILPNQERKGTRVGFIFSTKHVENFLNKHYQNLITVGPAIGGNSYDKFMAGIFLTNVKLPLNKFNFFVAPMYAFGSKRFIGIGKLDYSFNPNKAFRKVSLFLNGSTFTQDEYEDSTGKKTSLGFQKIVPGIRFTLMEKDPRSTLQRYVQWKTFFITEEELNFSRDSVFNPPGVVTTTTKITRERFLNQLLLVIENFRPLYPYRGELRLEQAGDFVRAGFTGNYFFNYAKRGGLNVRLFAGKFFYLGSKTSSKQFETDRFHLNMTGANGYEDYTYSDYFIGRNEFEGLQSQQIMMRDGNFKVRTDLLADKVGKTDDWLIATNFTSSIPNSINPLSLLPFNVPLKVFFDLGTYAEAWDKNAEGDHFLFDAGLQLSFLKNTVHIYMPLIYSPVYKEYIQSTLEKQGRFFKKISFTIDISNFTAKKIDWRIPF